MNIVDKIGRDLWKENERIMKKLILRKGKSNINDCIEGLYKSIKRFTTSKYSYFNEPAVKYGRSTEDCKYLLRLELKNIRKAKITDGKELSKISKMIKGDEEMMNLAGILINNLRDKRLKYERSRKNGL